MSPTTCTRYLENRALYAVVLLMLKEITLTAFLTNSTELETLAVIFIIGKTPSSTKGLQ
jgi:hypothetical protein